MENNHISFRHRSLCLFIKNAAMPKIIFFNITNEEYYFHFKRNASPNAFFKHSNPSLIKTNGIPHFFKIAYLISKDLLF